MERLKNAIWVLTIKSGNRCAKTPREQAGFVPGWLSKLIWWQGNRTTITALLGECVPGIVSRLEEQNGGKKSFHNRREALFFPSGNEPNASI
jgi:hypothetical protein